jgi:tetratricopeptide (TPR) repeat protein
VIHAFLGELEPAAERVDQAVEIAEALDLPDVLSDALNTRSFVLHRTGRDHEALLTIEGALKIARDRHLGRELLRSLYNLSFSLGVWDRDVEARRANLEGLELARERRNQFWEHHFIFNLVSEDVILGDWDAALRRAAVSVAHGQAPGVLFGEVALPWVLVERGKLEEARRILESMAPFAAREGPQSRSLEALARAAVRRGEGRAREALDAAEEVLARRAGLGDRHFYVKFGFVEAVEAAFALDDLDRVAELLREWDEHSAERRTPFVEAQEQLFAARLAACRGEPEPVEPSMVRAATIFRELSQPFYVAVTLLENGEWLAGHGRGGDAKPLLDEAQEIFERLRAAPWLERVSRACSFSDAQLMRPRNDQTACRAVEAGLR